MPFKPKTNKKININENSIVTVDSKHQEIINEIDATEKELPKLKKQKKIIMNKLEQNEFSSIEEKLEYTDLLQAIKSKIKKIKIIKKKYYLDNSRYIFEYFETKKNVSKNQNKKIILNNFFKQSTNNTDNDNEINTSKKFLINVDESFLDINDYITTHDVCQLCNGELVYVEHEGIMVCKICSNSQLFLVEHEKPNYKEPPKEICFYAYKRINHFREILAQFQAKETTLINDEVFENIKKQIKKERITLEQLTNDKTKHILKKLGYNKYYEHIPFIKEKLGIRPPTMSVELENRLCNLFMEIQKPYAKFCPNERVNFLNYYYVLYKLCELLGEDHYLPHFYMLKDPIKRMEQDEIWKKICNELHWQFINTP